MEVTIKFEDSEIPSGNKFIMITEDDNRKLGIYMRLFDSTCVAWSKDPWMNKKFLLLQQEYANELLKRRGYLFLNEVFDMLGMSRTKVGQVTGWIYDEQNPLGDNFVDFGIVKEYNADFINCLEADVLLDFNVDGEILSRL